MNDATSKAHEIQETIGCIKQALINSECRSQPYPYWQLSGLFPGYILKQLQDLSLPHFDYNEGYGARNIYNNIVTTSMKIIIKSTMPVAWLLRRFKVRQSSAR